MAENQFQGHQEKSKSERSANRAKGLCVRERKADSFFLSLSLSRHPFVYFCCRREKSAGNATELAVSRSQILILFGAASDVEPGSIQLVLSVT